jgi:hypothetical protein
MTAKRMCGQVGKIVVGIMAVQREGWLRLLLLLSDSKIFDFYP